MGNVHYLFFLWVGPTSRRPTNRLTFVGRKKWLFKNPAFNQPFK